MSTTTAMLAAALGRFQGRPTGGTWSDLWFAAGLVAGAGLVLRVPPLRRDEPRGGVDALVVIPARNEAASLGNLLDDLNGQRFPPARVVVVDDSSCDATVAAAAARVGVEIRPAGPTPPGWNPKSWAIHRGVVDATEDVIVLLDADVRLHAEALASLLAAHRNCGGWLSVAPRHDTVRAAEALSLPFNLVALMGAAGGRGAIGPCMVISLDQYRTVGGHAAVAGDLLDDVALAGRARAAGTPVTLLVGGDLVRYRMYPGGWREVIEGWTKNIAAGAARAGPLRSGLVALWVAASVWPLGSGRRLTPNAIRWVAAAAVTSMLGRRVGRFPWWAGPAGPLLAVVFSIVFARSAWLAVRGRPVRWKGRHLLAGAGIQQTGTQQTGQETGRDTVSDERV